MSRTHREGRTSASSRCCSTEVVGPVIGRDLQRKGIYATLASLVGIMTYIALRFRFSFGIGAMVASLHDVLITLSFITFFGYELSLNVVAAILTLTGYGVNDQIVIFDRVRENLRKNRRETLDNVINTSVNQTLPRTIITAGTTSLSVLSLYLFGGEVLEGLRVRHARRHHHQHLFDRLHRLGDRRHAGKARGGRSAPPRDRTGADRRQRPKPARKADGLVGDRGRAAPSTARGPRHRPGTHGVPADFELGAPDLWRAPLSAGTPNRSASPSTSPATSALWPPSSPISGAICSAWRGAAAGVLRHRSRRPAAAPDQSSGRFRRSSSAWRSPIFSRSAHRRPSSRR